MEWYQTIGNDNADLYFMWKDGNNSQRMQMTKHRKHITKPHV